MSQVFDSRNHIVVHGLDAKNAMIQMLVQSGKSAFEAQLLAERNTSGMVEAANLSVDAIAPLARWEGLTIWSSGDRVCMAGAFAAFRSLLMRWPEAAGAEIGRQMAHALEMPLQVTSKTAWLGMPPKGWGQRPVVMGILNVTPDSFSDGGRYQDPAIAVDRALAMIADGADILDIGGESTRPGADEVPAAEEIARVVPVVRAIVRQTDVPVSIDTCKAEVARAAIDAGATILNDIRGLRDPEMLSLAANTGAPAIFMHMQGFPRTMQQNPQYAEVVAEVVDWLRLAGEKAMQAGVRREQLIADPGIGFGKSTTHNLELLARLGDLRCLGFPVLLGASRKSVIGNVLGLPVDQRVEGTAAITALAVREHVEIVRVHDVKQIRRVVEMSQAIVSAQWV